MIHERTRKARGEGKHVREHGDERKADVDGGVLGFEEAVGEGLDRGAHGDDEHKHASAQRE